MVHAGGEDWPCGSPYFAAAAGVTRHFDPIAQRVSAALAAVSVVTRFLWSEITP
jgi:hypothetical protein